MLNIYFKQNSTVNLDSAGNADSAEHLKDSRDALIRL
jgi:hypothetical protein